MFLLVAALFCLSNFANGFPIEDCGSTFGNFSQITISGCDKTLSTCILHKGKNATIEIDFTTSNNETIEHELNARVVPQIEKLRNLWTNYKSIDEDATDLKTVVHGTVLILPIPFKVPHPDTCTDPNSGITCPLRKGGSFHYKATLPVAEKYPSVSVTIKWELQDQDGRDIVCIRLPAKLK